MPSAPTVVSFLSALTLIGQIISISLLILLFHGARGGYPTMLRRVSVYGLVLMLIVALTATFGSLYFSDVALWTPCKLCWFQRIFMYPQVPLLALALWKRDRRIAPYILLLCVIGALFSAVHYAEQVQAALAPPADPNVPCDTSGVSCASTPFFHFGYITIPLMAFTAFVMNGLGSIAMMRTTFR